MLLSALATESIGIHALFGAFLLGAIIPHDSAARARRHANASRTSSRVLFLPAFFAFTGHAHADRPGRSGARTGCSAALIILVATVGKFGGTAVAARLTGLALARRAALGILMNTRGLMELIVLNIGLDLGVISPALVRDAGDHGAGHDDDDDADPDKIHGRHTSASVRPSQNSFLLPFYMC